LPFLLYKVLLLLFFFFLFLQMLPSLWNCSILFWKQ
jgi:hypothetical protein